jgi:hypothetical protein
MLDIQTLRQNNFIKNLQGRDFILYSGLIWLAHEEGLQGIQTELIEADWENGRFVFKATATGKRGTYTGYGDATTRNVSKGILPHALRMAETRAKARALRDYTSIGLCSVEEL